MDRAEQRADLTTLQRARIYRDGPLAYTFVGSIISQVTLHELGIDVSPHLFRHSAVHTIAAHHGEKIGVGSAILQHTDPRTTAIYDTKARSIQAGRALQTLILNLSGMSAVGE